MRALPYTLFVAALIASPAQAEGLNLGRVTWSAFTCATYAVGKDRGRGLLADSSDPNHRRCRNESSQEQRKVLLGVTIASEARAPIHPAHRFLCLVSHEVANLKRATRQIGVSLRGDDSCTRYSDRLGICRCWRRGARRWLEARGQA